MTWLEAMERYGSDKPDMRFGMELVELDRGVRGDRVPRVRRRRAVKGICVPGEGDDVARSKLDALDRPGQAARRRRPRVDARARRRRARVAGREVPAPRPSSSASSTRSARRPGDLVLIVAGDRADGATTCSGSCGSTSAARRCTKAGCTSSWVVDFPLFEGLDDDGRPIPAHHPFTMPHPDDIDRLESRARPARRCARRRTTSCSTAGSSARAACGSTAPTCSSGSSRCSASTPEDAQARFGFLLDAFRFGAPPHAGFAVGIDRFAAILAGEENIREVIAFPKTQSGVDPLTGAPSAIDAAQLQELGLGITPRPKP